MNPLELKIARKTIASRDYRARRMEKLNREIAYWMTCEATSNSSRHREYCRKTQQMYLKRYEYYLNKKI